MTATDELRRLLDERGVEYELTAWSCGAAVWWRDSSGTLWRAHDNENDDLLSFYAYNSVTPEQAVAATLGDVPRLPHFWTADGTLHVEPMKLPESISVRLPDQRDREVRSARTWQYTLGAGTCHDKNGFDQDTGFECTACGAMVDSYMITLHDTGHEVQFNFCPNCGARVVNE